jgi:hypothetical protein
LAKEQLPPVIETGTLGCLAMAAIPRSTTELKKLIDSNLFVMITILLKLQQWAGKFDIRLVDGRSQWIKNLPSVLAYNQTPSDIGYFNGFKNSHLGKVMW